MFMGVIDFNKPEKTMSVEAWKGLSADGAPPGVYVPNMTDEDRRKYKGKVVNGEVPRIEVRVSLPSEILIKVKAKGLVRSKQWDSRENKLIHEHGENNIKISMNGPMDMTFEQWEKFKLAIDEAIVLAKEQEIK